MKLIAGFALAAPDASIYQQLLGVYGEVRGAALRRSLASPFSVLREDLAGPGTGNYQRGSHPYIQTLEQMVALLQAEQRFATQVLPSPAEALARVGRAVAEEWLVLTQSLSGIVARGLDRGEWAEQVFVLDLASSFSRLAREDSAELAVLEPALRVLVASAGQIVERVRRDVEQEGRQASTSPAPSNGTAMELTGSLLTLLRRMAEYSGVVEALLSRDSPTALLPDMPVSTELPLLSAYYQNALRWLEAAIELRAKGYKRPVVGLLFRLNNYRYIQRVIAQSHLSELLPADTQTHYHDVLQQLKDQYAATWRAISRLLDANEPLPGSIGIAMATTSKDRARIFINEVQEAVKLQSALSVPDQEFRSALRDLVRTAISAPFDDFYSKYTVCA